MNTFLFGKFSFLQYDLSSSLLMFTRNSLSNQLKIWWPQLNLQSMQKKGVGEQFPNPAMGTHFWRLKATTSSNTKHRFTHPH